MDSNEIKKLAKNLINYSVHLQKGEKVLIEGSSLCQELIIELINEVYKVGAYPFIHLSESEITRELLKNTNSEQLELNTKYMKPVMEDMDAYIGIGASNNINELHEVSIEKRNLYSKLYSKPIHSDIRVAKTKWVILQFPTHAYAQKAGMSTNEYANFYFKVCNLNYEKMNKAMDNLKTLMEKTDKVRIVAYDTDLTFSIKGMPAIKCAGEMNIPDGEIYTAPIKNSVNGYIHYNTPSSYNGTTFKNVKLYFENGKIIKCESEANIENLESIFNIDEGARFVGEFAIGVNPHIIKPMDNILFDEKITGSIHFTPGASYEDAYNGNDSAVHWDLVLIQTKEYGGGEIYFDGKLIRKDGIFVEPSLLCLNPENLTD